MQLPVALGKEILYDTVAAGRLRSVAIVSRKITPGEDTVYVL